MLSGTLDDNDYDGEGRLSMMTTEQSELYAFILEIHKTLHISRWVEQMDFALDLKLLTPVQHHAWLVWALVQQRNTFGKEVGTRTN
jgi:hypothetical protein